MSLKENLQKKIKIERLTKKIQSSMREIPGKRHLDKEAVSELLAMTDFGKTRTRDLTLYVRPIQEELKEVLVLDNELPIYHTTIADVAMRKTPHWKEMFSIGNIKKVLNDNDVIASKSSGSLDRVKQVALAQLDFSFSREDLEKMLRDAQISLDKGSLAGVQESLDLFSELLNFQSIRLEVQEPHIRLYARVKEKTEKALICEDLIVFDEKQVEVKLLQGDFSSASDSDLTRFLRCAHGELPADMKGEEVFQYLVETAMQMNTAKGPEGG